MSADNTANPVLLDQAARYIMLLPSGVDPTATAVEASKGTVGIDLSGAQFFQKKDDGSTTNWVLVGGSGVTCIDDGAGAGSCVENDLVGNTATGVNSHAAGENTEASGDEAHAEGQGTVASGDQSHAQNLNTTASGNRSHAEGNSSEASGIAAHAEGQGTVASGDHSHAEGLNSEAQGDDSHAEGAGSIASGIRSHAEGETSTASGLRSHAEGWNTTASALASHAEGNASQATAEGSHSEGSSLASGEYSHAEGADTVASGADAHSEGRETVAAGDYSHAEGYETQAAHESSLAVGHRSLTRHTAMQAHASYADTALVAGQRQHTRTLLQSPSQIGSRELYIGDPANTERFSLPNNSSYCIHLKVVAYNQSTVAACWDIQLLTRGNTIVGSSGTGAPTFNDAGAAGWTVALGISGNNLTITLDSLAVPTLNVACLEACELQGAGI